jgi:hypothetical protein
VGLFVGEHLIMPAVVVSAIIAVACLVHLASGHYRISAVRDRWLLWFVAFMLVGWLSLMVSPYLNGAFTKGITQIVGVSMMLLTTLAFLNEIERRPALFSSYVRLCVRLLAILAAVGVVQSFVENVLRAPSFFDFSFFNQYAGGMIWKNPGRIGPLWRAAAIQGEPSYFVVVLGVAAGPALVRLGVLGQRYRRAISSVVSRWAAVMIVLGLTVALSLLGYVLLFSTIVSLRLVSRRVGWKTIVDGSVSGLVLIASLFLIVSVLTPAFMTKVASLNLIFSSDSEGFAHLQESALVMAQNRLVVEHNLAENPLLGAGLGAHPVAFEQLSPGSWLLPQDVAALQENKDDAASLLFRLLSETGLLGTSLYVAGLLAVALRARRSILVSTDSRAAARGLSPSPRSVALSAGMIASLVGCGVANFARVGSYYPPPLWISLALVACVPRLLSPCAAESPASF